MIDGVELQNLQEKAKNIRKSIVEMVYNAASGHPGGSLSIADVFTALYFKELNIDINNTKDENRDRVVLSKGHCSPALYSTLAEKGFFDKSGFWCVNFMPGIEASLWQPTRWLYLFAEDSILFSFRYSLITTAVILSAPPQ